MNYPWINEALIIIKWIILFYIFIQKKLFKFKFQSWFKQILEPFEVSMNFIMFELDLN
jgi:hypothetical protein